MTHLLRSRFWVSAQRIALVAASVVLVIAIATPDGSTSGRPGTPRGPARPATMGLVAYSSCADLLAGLRAHAAASVGPWGLPGSLGSLGPQYAVPAAAPGAARDSGAQKQATPGHSTTNVHEAGVDEPDIVKTDGDRIVTVSGGRLRVIDTASRKVTGDLPIPGAVGWQPADLLLAGDRVLVVLHPSFEGQYPVPDAPGRPAIDSPAPIKSTYLLIDLSGQPRVLDSISADGRYVDARMVGSTVRLVVRSGPDIRFPTDSPGNLTDAQRIARNQTIVRQAPLSAWLPTYDTASGPARTVPCGQISHPIDYTGTSMLTIYTINLAQSLDDLAPVTLAADGDTVYATHSSLYVTSNPMWWGCCFADDVVSTDPVVPVVRSVPVRTPPVEKTEIHRFDISGPGAPRYLGSGSVPGRLLSQYSLSDYQGYLRVATTTTNANTNTATADRGPASSSVYVLAADTLRVTGHVDGLGRGEQIYAVRFEGPLGYVVTFRQTDPLYVIDLRDPPAPRRAGELELTGYSAYLHPAGDGRLIGVGQEANSQGRVAGLQVSLFDVSNSSAPSRLAHVVRPDAPGEGQLDPHAFLYWPSTGVVVVPIQSWAGTSSGKVLVLRLSHSGLTTVGLISHPLARSAPDDPGGIARSMVVGDSIWTLSSAGIKVSDMTTLADQAWIPFG